LKFLKTIEVKKFKDILFSIPRIPLDKEFIPLDESYNRRLYEDIKSNIDVPHFRKSRVDGYAVIARDTFGAEEDNILSLKLVEKIEAGQKPTKKLNNGECSYVATGAAIPENADAIIMVEYTEITRDKVYISKAVPPGENIVNIGHDIKKGELICKKGQLIDLPTLGMLASCGLKEVPVYRKPIVSLMSTGNELVPVGKENLDIGQIYDVNSTVLKKAIENAGAKVSYLGIIRDNFEDLKSAIDRGLKESDIVILSGGTSKGEGDLGSEVLKNYYDVEILIHGVKMRPGKPIIFTKIKEKFVFILPGFPTSALSCYYVFIEDFLRKNSGLPLKIKNSLILEIGERIYSIVGRHEFKPVIIRKDDGVDKIFPIKTGSEAISTLFKADGYIEIEELESIVEKGEKRRFFYFS